MIKMFHTPKFGKMTKNVSYPFLSKISYSLQRFFFGFWPKCWKEAHIIVYLTVNFNMTSYLIWRHIGIPIFLQNRVVLYTVGKLSSRWFRITIETGVWKWRYKELFMILKSHVTIQKVGHCISRTIYNQKIVWYSKCIRISRLY